MSVTTVFVVDDDCFMRDLLTRVFTGAGIQVRCFGSAAELLGSADLGGSALLLLDVKMPDMSGLELQEVLISRGVDHPVIFLTGASDIPMAVAAMRNGALDFIEKPFNSNALVERVRRVIDRSADRSVHTLRPPDATYLARLNSLTPREREVHALLVTGKSSKLIARELGGSFRTIEIHRGRVMSKMLVANLAELVRMNAEAGEAFGRPASST